MNLIALGGNTSDSTGLAFAGKRSYVRPGIFIQSFASGLKRTGEPSSGGGYLPEKLESTPDPAPLGSGDLPLPYPNMPELEYEGTVYRMTQQAALDWKVQVDARMTAQAIAENWHIQDDFEWRAPLRRFVGSWIGVTGSLFPEEDSPAYDVMLAAWAAGKRHVFKTHYPNNPYGTYALGWARPFLNPTGYTQRRNNPTTAEIAFIKARYWDTEDTHYVHAHFKPGSDSTLNTPAKFREAYRLWASSEKTRLTADGVPESKWTISIWLPFFSGDHEEGTDPAAAMDYLVAALEGIAEAQWPSVDIGGVENFEHAAAGFSSRAAFVDQLLLVADRTVFVDGLPGPSGTFSPSVPSGTGEPGQPQTPMAGSPAPLSPSQEVHRSNVAMTIMQLGVPATYFAQGQGPGVPIRVYISDSEPEIRGGSPERSKDNLPNRRRQGWRLICLAGTHRIDPGLGVVDDTELSALSIDPGSIVRLRSGDVFAIDGVYLGRAPNETVRLRVPERAKVIDRAYWSAEAWA